jgi:hypothetical protein
MVGIIYMLVGRFILEQVGLVVVTTAYQKMSLLNRELPHHHRNTP